MCFKKTHPSAHRADSENSGAHGRNALEDVRSSPDGCRAVMPCHCVICFWGTTLCRQLRQELSQRIIGRAQTQPLEREGHQIGKRSALIVAAPARR